MITAVGAAEGVNVEVGGLSQPGVDVHTALDSAGGKFESPSSTVGLMPDVALNSRDGLTLEVGAANVKVEPVGIAEYGL
jgi:hypothetical protein